MAVDPLRLPLPPALLDALHAGRRERIHCHWVAVSPDWWNHELEAQAVPGGPLNVTFSSDGRPGISRGAIFELASSIGTAEGLYRLLWHALAWGGGTRARLMRKRIEAVAVDLLGAADVLREAAALAHTSPPDAYHRLYPSGRTTLKFLGPAFFTKFLYFTGGGAATHPSLILDSVVATRLRSLGWGELRRSAWSDRTYALYCELTAQWARPATNALTRDVAPDEIERWLFSG